MGAGKAAEEGASQETGLRRFQPACVPRGTKEPVMPVCVSLRRSSACPSAPTATFRKFFCALTLLFITAATAHAASIRGIVTDPSGARVNGATVNLVYNGKVIATVRSASDGSFEMTTGIEGRFFLVISASTFRQVETPGFYAGRADSIERNLVLEPEWARQSIVVTATGVPTPQAQTSEATNVLGPIDLDLRDDLTSALRLMPGTAVVQSGQLGSQTSLFIRGGNSVANKILVDGVDAGDMGGQVDFGALSTTVVQSAEVYRGTNSSLYGADAGSGVISLTTPHGTTSFPSFIFRGDAGSFYTSHEELEAAGAHNKLDYLGAFSWLQTNNDLPNDEFHVATTTANVGWQPSGNTQVRATLHYGVDGTGVPNTWDFYHVADQATEKDQDIFLSASIDNQTTADFHNSLRYGLTRKREQYNLWATSGGYQAYNNYCYGPAYLGNLVTITGANGYSATGQAVLDCSAGHDQNVNNRDQLSYQGDYRFTPHLTALVGFHYENERGSEPGSAYYPPISATNYDYIATVHGDFKGRFFYTLGGSVERYSLFGVQTSPRAGVAYYALRPRSGVFSGTKVLFNYGDAVREPKLTDEDGSLYTFLEENQGQATIQQFHISRLSPPTTRTYEGGVEQAFLSNHILWRTSYFHSEFGKELEYLGLSLIPEFLPNLSTAQQQALGQILTDDFAYGFTVNTEAFRAQGIESSVESGIGRHIFLRGGYTYLDAVVQRSFSNDELSTGIAIPTYNGIPIGAYSPLRGARPFRRPPHTGYFTATYSARKLTAAVTAAFAGRSDDSTYLEGQDAEGASSLLLPNRNLDHGYAKIDLGGSYKLLDWLDIYIRQENLANSQHIAPIGYPSLPMTFRLGLRIALGKPGGK
jgi:iron complex outermembrane receptor protein/vitamin B12 transporter